MEQTEDCIPVPDIGVIGVYEFLREFAFEFEESPRV
jgi:hypothetical protein